MSLPPLNWQAPEIQAALQTFCYNTPVGSLAIHMRGKQLFKLEWLLTLPEGETKLPSELEQQLKQYWLTGIFSTNLALLQQGTEFQQNVWCALQLIPLGQTRTYGQLAQELSTAPRALANACRQNPFPLIIPCHRVLAKTGLGGYAGATSGKLIEIKTALLQHEKKMIYDL